jgi:hypothetical protein
MTDKSSQAAAGTVVDVEYTGGYFAHQSPSLMRYIALINGYTAPDISGEFTYCELGCGRGVTSLALAASHRRGKFVACDINPAHVRGAAELARTAGVDNVAFMERSFGAMLSEDVPGFDFITLHGIYSWVAKSVRDEICAFIRQKLKPGGLVMVSYNAMPGWAHIDPVRRMMLEYAANVPGSSIDKARQAFTYVKFLADNKAGYFAANPAAAGHLSSIQAADGRYVAHEYMAPFSTPFYFADVAADMRGAGLAYAGNMAPVQNYPGQSVPPAFRELMRTSQDRMILETHRDFIANTRFRNDLFALQPPSGKASAMPDANLSATAYRLAAQREALPLKGERDGVTFDFARYEGAVKAVHDLIASKGVASFGDIMTAAGLPAPACAGLVQDMVLARHLLPGNPDPKAKPLPKFRRAMTEFALRERQDFVLHAGPGTGSVEYVDLGFTLALAALENGAGKSSPVEAVLARLREHGHTPRRKQADGSLTALSEQEVRSHFAGACSAAADPEHPSGRFLRALGTL